MAQTQYKEGLPMAQTRRQKELWNKLRPVIMPAACDTYKRTMSGSNEVFADNFACYSLAARRASKEKDIGRFDTEETDPRLIMAGLERMLYPWFMFPVEKEEIDEAREHFTQKAQVNMFPEKAWQAVLDNKGYIPLDIWGLPGGQTFLAKDKKYVPMMSVEGMGALATHLEPHLEHIYADLIQATKARHMFEVTGPGFAEFGLRADKEINIHVPLMFALYIGGGFQYTSDDQAAILFPDYFLDIGTMGHENIMAEQREGISLEEAQERAFDKFVKRNKRSALLVDTIDTIRSGFPAVLRMMDRYKNTDKIIMPRMDSGDVLDQCITWKKMTLAAKFPSTKMVVEDGYNPYKAQKTKAAYRAAGFDPNDIIVGAGGFFQENVLRDVVSLVDKRSATMHDGVLELQLKFSDEPGKGSIPGRIRIYERDRTLIVGQAGEDLDAKMISVPLVRNGRIVYFEDLKVQHQRAQDTWNKYDKIEYSPATQKIIDERTIEHRRIVERYDQMEVIA
jgi:nicotinate phosphoribosyltransferase